MVQPFRELFRTAYPTPIWRLWPAPGALALELRDAAARTVTFVVIETVAGREIFRYHDPAVPWWLALRGFTGPELLLTELNPDQLGAPGRLRTIRVPRNALTAASPPPAWRVPEVSGPDGPYFAALAQLVATHTGARPRLRLEWLEGEAWTALAFDQPDAAGIPPRYELLLVPRPATGGYRRSLGRLSAGGAGSGDPLFCTFGPILYALGAPGEVIAWALPGT